MTTCKRQKAEKEVSLSKAPLIVHRTVIEWKRPIHLSANREINYWVPINLFLRWATRHHQILQPTTPIDIDFRLSATNEDGRSSLHVCMSSTRVPQSIPRKLDSKPKASSAGDCNKRTELILYHRTRVLLISVLIAELAKYPGNGKASPTVGKWTWTRLMCCRQENAKLWNIDWNFVVVITCR